MARLSLRFCTTTVQTLKAMRETASSSATTWRMMLTNGPFAWYCRMVMMVEAGAVAQPIAPSSSEKGTGRRKIKIIVRVTAAAATSDSARVMAMTLAPLFLRAESLK